MLLAAISALPGAWAAVGLDTVGLDIFSIGDSWAAGAGARFQFAVRGGFERFSSLNRTIKLLQYRTFFQSPV
jgi:hypothetical protein